MKAAFSNVRISSIVAVVPSVTLSFDEEHANYGLSPAKAERFRKMMGVGTHRIAPPEVTASDLCLHGVEYLLERGVLRREEIGALIFVSQTPDYFLPPTSNVLQGKLGLDHDVLCMDINQGCAGFLIGLMQAFLLLRLDDMRKVVLLNGDTASKQLSPMNRVSWPLVGDGGAVTVVERSVDQEPVYSVTKMDGSRHDTLMIPAGAYRTPSSAETREEVEVEEGVRRSKEQIHMNGAGVFAFTMESVPPQIEEVLAFAAAPMESIDAFLFHQPNEFMLTQLGEKIGLDMERFPRNNVGIYGNTSSVSIPLNAAHAYGKRLTEERMRVCLSGFGVGLTWSSMVLNLGPLDLCEVIER